jgi:uncharacterized protein YbjT (DUF2867 family)
MVNVGTLPKAYIMKIVITGSLGHISKPLAQELVQKAHSVTVISHDANRQKDIEAIGAAAAIGSLEDAGFLTRTFAGADAVYTMIPPGNYFDHNFDLGEHYRITTGNYVEAIRQSGVKRAVHLSSVGAHMEKDSGLILFHHEAEKILGKLPDDISITFMRPVGFYYNLYGFMNVIKKQGVIAANYGADDRIVWVSPKDIAAAVAEELQTGSTGRNIRYVASDELTGNETASILGAAIGQPELKWKLIPDEQMQAGLEMAGMHPGIVASMVEMYSSMHRGELGADYDRHRPAVMGNVKMADFAKEFAAAFRQQ